MTNRQGETTTPNSKWVNHNGPHRDTLRKSNFQLPEINRFQPFQRATIPLYNKRHSEEFSTRFGHWLFYSKSAILIRDRYQPASRRHPTDYAHRHTRPVQETSPKIRPLPDHTDPENNTPRP